MNRYDIISRAIKTLKGLNHDTKVSSRYCAKCDSLECRDDSHMDYWIDVKTADKFLTWLDNVEYRGLDDDIRTGARKIEEMSEEEFKMNIGHWFMPPLGIAEGIIELAIRDEKDKEQIEKMKIALHAVNRIKKVVRNIQEKREIHE